MENRCDLSKILTPVLRLLVRSGGRSHHRGRVEPFVFTALHICLFVPPTREESRPSLNSPSPRSFRLPTTKVGKAQLETGLSSVFINGVVF